MLEGLQIEIDKHPELTGASREIIISVLNTEPAETEAWIVRSDELKVPKGDILALLSMASQVKIFDWLAAKSDPAKGFSLFFFAHDQFKVADPTFRGTIQLLHNPLELITVEEQDAMLRLGERLKTRSEEIWGRPLNEGDFE